MFIGGPMTLIVALVLAALLIAGVAIVLRAARQRSQPLFGSACAHCRKKNPHHAKFCAHCGQALG